MHPTTTEDDDTTKTGDRERDAQSVKQSGAHSSSKFRFGKVRLNFFDRVDTRLGQEGLGKDATETVIFLSVNFISC